MTSTSPRTHPPRTWRRLALAASALILLSTLSACGQKGDLVRPGKTAADHVR